MSFTLDGAPLATTQTAVKRFLGSTDSYYSQWGRVMAPSDLAVGPHSLSVVITNAAGTLVYYTGGITLLRRPAGHRRLPLVAVRRCRAALDPSGSGTNARPWRRRDTHFGQFKPARP